MSLDRFINKEELLSKQSSQPNKWTEELVSSNLLGNLAIDMPGTFQGAMVNGVPVSNADVRSNIEAHIYSPGGDYLDSAYMLTSRLDTNNKLGINTSDFANKINVKSGNYLAVFNIHNSLSIAGDYNDRGLKIVEISPDRKEIYLRGNPACSKYDRYLSSISDGLLIIPEIRKTLVAGNLVLNFGKNRVSTIVNINGWNDSDGMVVKLLKPLNEEVGESDLAWIDSELADPTVFSIVLDITPEDVKVYIRRANFDAESNYNIITETDFKNYTELLGKSTSTSEQIVQQLLSGSFSDPIGIDYSGFQNFVFYSSAAERLANFKYKLQQIEHYDNQISLLQLSSSIIPTLGTDKALAESRKTSVIGTFDGFEKWLYNEPTSSLFTHQDVYDQAHTNGNPTRLEGGVLASDVYQIQPFPKFITGSSDPDGAGEYTLHGSESTLGTEWYNGTLASASLYDSENEKILLNSIPEHIRLDSNNDQYELFVNMIGHHFDILYSYADALAKTYHPIEHPKLGHTKDTLYQVAESLGWKLFNGKQASALWQYKLGKSETGSLASTGSIFTKTDEDITTEVWRRIVNNLPYLLKTKGTARGIKSLMNTYGIPQTLLSIREYGGPAVAEDKPTLIEDRFSYALQFDGGKGVDAIDSPHIKYNPRNYTTNIGSWGFQREGLSSGAKIPEQTREFRFKPAVKESMVLMSTVVDNDSPVSSDVRVYAQLVLEHTGSYSGSDNYGRLVLCQRGAHGTFNPITGSTDWAPLYDGEFWNARYFFTATGSGAGTYNEVAGLNTTYHIQVQKASDYISGKIIHRVSASFVPTDTSHKTGWSSAVNDNHKHRICIGGHPGTGTSKDQFQVNTNLRRFMGETSLGFTNANGPNLMMFSGSMQEYRSWLEHLSQKTFDFHTLNPTSYASSLTATSSYDTLVRHYPLGTDLNAVDHTLTNHRLMTSSHPAQTVLDAQLQYGGDPEDLVNSGSSYATMSFFPTPTNSQRGNYEPVEETYYVQGVSLGATLPKSQKIRFDDNELITTLSPVATAETSRFDNASIDSNRLGLFYSMADQINKEIFNQIGDIALDDYVGDPDDTYELEYHDLTDFAKGYWKKYTDKNDINAYMRIFSQFDFALFESIRQMLPDRADEVMGLLVEPHALERSKAVPFKKPEQSSHHYEALVPSLEPSASTSYRYYEGEASGSSAMIGTLAFTPPAGDNGYSDDGNYFGSYQRNFTSSTDYFTKQVFPKDLRPSVSASFLNGYIVVNEGKEGLPRDTNYRWLDATCGNLASQDNNDLAQNGSIDLDEGFATDIVRAQFKTYTQTATIQDFKITVDHQDSTLNASGSVSVKLITTEDNAFARNRSVSASAFPYKHLTETRHSELFKYSGATERTDTFLFANVHVPKQTNVTVELILNNPEGSVSRPHIDHIGMIQTINKAGYGAQDLYIDKVRPSTIFRKKTFHFHETDPTKSSYFNDDMRRRSGSKHRKQFTNSNQGRFFPGPLVFSQSLDITQYRDDESFKINSKYLGSQLSAPGVNDNSGYAELNYEPIVQVFITNPNQIVYNATPTVTVAGQENPGNLEVDSGPGIIVNRPFRPISNATRN